MKVVIESSTSYQSSQLLRHWIKLRGFPFSLCVCPVHVCNDFSFSICCDISNRMSEPSPKKPLQSESLGCSIGLNQYKQIQWKAYCDFRHVCIWYFTPVPRAALCHWLMQLCFCSYWSKPPVTHTVVGVISVRGSLCRVIRGNLTVRPGWQDDFSFELVQKHCSWGAMCWLHGHTEPWALWKVRVGLLTTF